jgi:hypothetical protein
MYSTYVKIWIIKFSRICKFAPWRN